MSDLDQCFVSYAHHDHAHFERLQAHLKPLAHLHDFRLWHDRRIRAGDHWSQRIQAEIDRSQMFVLLTTTDFLASDYILLHELPAIRRRRDAGSLVLPVILRDCGWKGFFGDYIQATPINAHGRLQPVLSWRQPEAALARAADAIGAAVEDWFDRPPRSLFGPPS